MLGSKTYCFGTCVGQTCRHDRSAKLRFMLSVVQLCLVRHTPFLQQDAEAEEQGRRPRPPVVILSRSARIRARSLAISSLLWRANAASSAQHCVLLDVARGPSGRSAPNQTAADPPSDFRSGQKRLPHALQQTAPSFGRHIRSRGIERSHSRRQTSFAPSQARKLPCSRKALRVHDSRIWVWMRICHASRDIVRV